MHATSFEFCPLHAKATIDAVCGNPGNALFPFLNYGDNKGNSASKILNEEFAKVEKYWLNDTATDKPEQYTRNLRTHSTRATAITLLSDVHGIKSEWIDNRSGLSREKICTSQTYFHGSCRSDTSTALALSNWPNPTAENGINLCMYVCMRD
jgi:hypothetical protein